MRTKGNGGPKSGSSITMDVKIGTKEDGDHPTRSREDIGAEAETGIETGGGTRTVMTNGPPARRSARSTVATDTIARMKNTARARSTSRVANTVDIALAQQPLSTLDHRHPVQNGPRNTVDVHTETAHVLPSHRLEATNPNKPPPKNSPNHPNIAAVLQHQHPTPTPSKPLSAPSHPTWHPPSARAAAAPTKRTRWAWTRFSSSYDPAIDVRPASDAEDNWGESVEAFRDRMRWKQQGAERLKAAGFTDDQLKKWEKGDMKDEEDVTWTKQGQKREWDRGKVVDEEGDVDVKAEWGRLK
tara:strand:- start:24542 stop:25438 length:897 start_codon:yes stop_codon:yes gene_type:complete